MARIKYFFPILIVPFIFVLLLPYFLESSWGRQWLSDKVSKKLKVDVIINKADLSWRGPQYFDDVGLRDQRNGTAKIGRVVVEDSLLSLIISGRPEKVKIENMNGVWNAASSTIRASDLNMSWNGADRNFQMQGNTHFGKENGHIDVSVGNLDPGNLSAVNNVAVDITQLPINLLEYGLRLAGFEAPSLQSLLGSTINLKVKEEKDHVFHMTLGSSAISAEGMLGYDGKVITTQSPLVIRWNNREYPVTGEYTIDSRTGKVMLKGVPLSLFEKVHPKIGQFLKGEVNALVGFTFEAGKIALQITITSDNFNIPLQFRVNIPTNGSKVSFDANAESPAFKMASKGNIDLSKSGVVLSALESDVRMNNFPFSDYVSDTLYAMIGSQNNLSVKLSYSEKRPEANQVELSMQGKYLDADIALAVDSHLRLLDSGKKAVVHAKIPPELLGELLADTPLKELHWASPVPVRLEVDKLQIPMDRLAEGNPSRFITSVAGQGVQGNVSIGPLEAMMPTTRKKLLLGLLNGSVTMEDGQKVRVSLASHGGSMNLQLNGLLDLNSLETMDVNFSGSDIPSIFVSLLAGFGREISDSIQAVFGGMIDINGQLNLMKGDGNVSLSLSSPSAKTSFDGRLQNGFLYLNQPWQLQANVTPDLVRMFLAPSVPVFAGLVSADGPLVISMDTRGFAIPVRSFDIRNVSIPAGVVRVGVLGFSQDSDLGSLISVLTPLPAGPIIVRSTPLYFNMKQGVLSMYRWDMLLVEKLPVACWGTVDFARQRVDLVLGLTPRAVEVAFNVSGLDADHLLQIPIRGRLGNVEIDKRGVAAQLTSLVARSRKGPEGLLIGTFLQLTGGMMNDLQAPAPTTQPLPWETASSKKGDSSMVEAVNEGMSLPVDVIQQGTQTLQKGASGLLNQLFR